VETADSLTTEYIDQIKADASNAMGIPVNNISVSIQKLLPEVVAEVQFSDTLGMFIERYGLYILMLILLAVMVILMIPRKKEEIEEELAAEPEAAFAGPQFIVPEKRMPGLPNIELGENDELKEQIEKFAAAKPDAVAQLLRNWLTEDWD
jgi:flagellar M-ring protein FliF